MQLRSVRHVVLIAAVCALPGCATTHGRPSGEPALGAELRVENRGWSDVVVYVVHAGVRTRLGTVTGVRTMSLLLPSRMLLPGDALRFVAHTLGSQADGDVASDPVYVRPGQRVVWTLEQDPRLSSIGVWDIE